MKNGAKNTSKMRLIYMGSAVAYLMNGGAAGKDVELWMRVDPAEVSLDSLIHAYQNGELIATQDSELLATQELADE
jgi:hypothetical protein